MSIDSQPQMSVHRCSCIVKVRFSDSKRVSYSYFREEKELKFKAEVQVVALEACWASPLV